MFEIKNFSFSYPFSLHKIGFSGSFKIKSGECVLISGNSGSGKSTLLQALKGLIPNQINGTLGGEISYRNKLIQSCNESELLKIGYLQQNPDHQIICNTVFNELAFGLENLQLSKNIIETKIIDIAQEFNISHLLQRNLHSLSGGEKQKVNLLAILLMDPDVLLLDEPTAFLDPQSAHEIISILKKYIHKKTVIIIEHNTHYLVNLIDRVINIDQDGQIELLDKSTINIPKIQIIKNDYKSDVLLNINNLNFSYRDNKSYLLKNINLTINSGEIISIQGKNGNGKSTLLKLIAKVIKQKQSIYYNDKDISQIKDKSYWKNVCLLWQNPENHFVFNKVSDEISDNGILIKFDLIKTKNQSPYNLSEGQKRRLSLSIAFSLDCKLYLLDEPSFGQDAKNKQILAETIQEIAASGKSFIIVSHDLAFIKALSHKIYTLHNGELCLS